MSVVILGLDTGGETSGYGVIRQSGSAAQPIVEFLAKGEIPSTTSAFCKLLAECDPFNASPGKVIAVERVGGQSHKTSRGASKVSALLAAGEIAGRFMAVAEMMGVQLVALTAGQWRAIVCRSNHPDDATIKAAIHRYVRGMPLVSNSHNRDGLGVALAAAWGAPGDPSPVASSLTIKQKAVRAARAAQKPRPRGRKVAR